MNDVIVGMGEVLWDMLPEGKKIGGAPANFAYHVSQYGFDGYVVSAVGDDKLGNEILESFNNRRLNYLIQRVPYPTGMVQIELDEAGIPCYEIKENVAWDNIPFTVDLEKLAKKTRAVCFGSLAQRNTVSRETINRFLDVMSDAAGQYRVFDVNLRQGFYDKEILCNSMKRCNILKINDEELIAVSRMFESLFVHAGEQDLARAQRHAAPCPLDDILARVFPPVVIISLITRAVPAFFRLDAQHHALAAERLGHLGNDALVLDGRGIDGRLVRPHLKNAPHIVHTAQAATYRDGNEHVVRGAPHDSRQVVAVVQTGDDVHIQQFVDTLPVIICREIMRVSQLAQSFQLNPLYQMVVLYVQTGDEAYFFRHAASSFNVFRQARRNCIRNPPQRAYGVTPTGHSGTSRCAVNGSGPPGA